MPLYDVFVPGQMFPFIASQITGGPPQPTAGPGQQVGMLVQGVNAASAAAAGAAVQAALQNPSPLPASNPGNQQGLMHVNTQSTNTNV